MLEAVSAGWEAGTHPGKVTSPSQETDIIHPHMQALLQLQSQHIFPISNKLGKNNLWILCYRLFLFTAVGV